MAVSRITPALEITDMTEEEVRLLRSCVRYELKLRDSEPSGPGSIPIERVRHIRLLARQFVQQ